MTAVFQDIEFGSRFPEFDQTHPRKKKAEKLWKQIAKNRSLIRSKDGCLGGRLGRVQGSSLETD
jgi:hypothetical protein